MPVGLTVAQLADAVAARCGGRLVARIDGPGDTPIRRPAPLAEAQSGDLAFLANPRYRGQLSATAASAVVLTAESAAALDAVRRPAVAIVCAQPYAWFALAAQALAGELAVVPAVADTAQVAASATVDPAARVDAYAVIDDGARVAAGAWVGAGCHVGRGAQVGVGTRLHPGARLLDGCVIGARGIVHSGVVIGADGFGFAPLDGRWLKIPQTGTVRLGDDVEVGANTTIDRGTMGDTVIEDGVKIDNQVQIAHNCRIGAHSAIAGCVGIAGSAVIGRGCQIGGAAMIHGHITLADGCVVSAGTLISRSLAEPGFYTGVFPFMRNRDWERNAALLRHLDDLRARIRRLEADRSDAGQRPVDSP